MATEHEPHDMPLIFNCTRIISYHGTSLWHPSELGGEVILAVFGQHIHAELKR